jgi:hypothetical protein
VAVVVDNIQETCRVNLVGRVVADLAAGPAQAVPV